MTFAAPLRKCVLTLSFFALLAQAAETPPPAVSPSTTAGGTIVELSPFEVRSDTDVGYQAANTTSGSRLNTRLKDTPASISPFTPEFLSDIAANNLEEMLGYATNVERDLEDANAGFNDPNGRQAGGGEFSFRVRGMPGGTSVDFTDSSIPVDLYNVERAEMTSGPNAVLFGLGSSGGTLALTAKRAGLNRDRNTLKAQFGSWQHQRYETDFNRVLRPQRLAMRLTTLYQDSGNWRRYGFNDQKRLNGAVAVKPFHATTVHVSLERGRMVNNGYIGLNAADNISLWNQSARPAADGAAVTGTTRFNQNNNLFTFFENDGRVFNLRGELQSAPITADTLVPTSLMPFDVSKTGPGAIRRQDFRSYRALAEHKFTRDFVVELAWFRNENDVRINTQRGAGVALSGDPNLTLPAPDGSAATVPNSRVRQLYLESTWSRETLNVTNDVVRLSAAWEKDLGRWLGRHRIAGMAERSEQERLRVFKDEILVDQGFVPVSNAALPEAAVNLLTRRRYVTEGDFAGYFGGDVRVPMPGFSVGGRQLGTAFVNRNTNNTSHQFKVIDSFLAATHSAWLDQRLIATVGYRRDQINFRNEQMARVTNPADPRVQARQTVLNEFDFTGTYTRNDYRPATLTAGAVAHVLPRLSVFHNFSKNVGAPRFDRAVLPDGGVPPPVEGRGHDSGVMLDLLGDERFFLRATAFKTEQLNDASITPGGNAIGNDNLFNILTALLNAGKISAAQYDRQNVSYNAAIIDVITKGYEVEFVANPTRALSLRVGYSYSDRKRANFFKEVYAFFRPKYDEWRSLAAGDAALLALVNNEIALTEAELDSQFVRQNSPFGTRPHKANATARYRFSEGRLKGTFIGGAVRYQGRNFISRDAATGRDYWGTPIVNGDAFAGYRLRLPWGNLPVTVQLNVRNLTNSCNVTVGRYNAAYSGVSRVYLQDPRSYRLTLSTEF
jgi:outer membrane receptor protein involved in Fe transport